MYRDSDSVLWGVSKWWLWQEIRKLYFRNKLILFNLKERGGIVLDIILLLLHGRQERHVHWNEKALLDEFKFVQPMHNIAIRFEPSMQFEEEQFWIYGCAQGETELESFSLLAVKV